MNWGFWFCVVGFLIAVYLLWVHEAGSNDVARDEAPPASGPGFDPQYLISYADADGVVTERQIYVFSRRRSGGVTHYSCWCFLRGETRTFRSDRILSIYNLSTDRDVQHIRIR